MRKKKILVVVIIFIAVIISATILFVVLSIGIPKHKSDSITNASVSVIATFRETITQSQTSNYERALSSETTENASEEKEIKLDKAITAPEDFIRLLSICGTTSEEVTEMACRQIITVESNGSNAQINFYRFSDNTWTLDSDLSCSGFVGSNGITENMHEGNYATPKGIFPISEAFFIHEPPVTGLPLFQITNDTYWIDDPDSAYYNRRIEGTVNKDWNSAEHMIDYPVAYEYGFVIDYNKEAVYNAGSAIFFHVSTSPTAGCIGTDRTMVLKYLQALNIAENPYIIIV